MPDERLEGGKEERLICTALLGVSIVSVVEFVGRTDLDLPLRVSLYCFAVAIPFLTAYLMVLNVSSRIEHIAGKWYLNALGISAILGALAGVGAVFWHFSRIIGLVFIACSIIGFFVWIIFEESVRKARS